MRGPGKCHLGHPAKHLRAELLGGQRPPWSRPSSAVSSCRFVIMRTTTLLRGAFLNRSNRSQQESGPAERLCLSRSSCGRSEEQSLLVPSPWSCEQEMGLHTVAAWCMEAAAFVNAVFRRWWPWFSVKNKTGKKTKAAMASNLLAME